MLHARVPKRRRERPKVRPKWDVGKKVAHILTDNQIRGIEPSTETALARLLDTDPSTVLAWTNEGVRPRSDMASDAASALGVDVGWLTDNRQGYPAPPKERASAVVSRFNDEELSLLAVVASQPARKRALVGVLRALAEGPPAGPQEPR